MSLYSIIFPRYIQMSREQELGLDRNRKRFDAREEYFVSSSVSLPPPLCECEMDNSGVCVEAECGESRGMGTEAHRETERFTGMGRRACGAAQPTPGCPSGLGTKDLNV